MVGGAPRRFGLRPTALRFGLCLGRCRLPSGEFPGRRALVQLDALIGVQVHEVVLAVHRPDVLGLVRSGVSPAVLSFVAGFAARPDALDVVRQKRGVAASLALATRGVVVLSRVGYRLRWSPGSARSVLHPRVLRRSAVTVRGDGSSVLVRCYSQTTPSPSRMYRTPGWAPRDGRRSRLGPHRVVGEVVRVQVELTSDEIHDVDDVVFEARVRGPEGVAVVAVARLLFADLQPPRQVSASAGQTCGSTGWAAAAPLPVAGRA